MSEFLLQPKRRVEREVYVKAMNLDFARLVCARDMAHPCFPRHPEPQNEPKAPNPR